MEYKILIPGQDVFIKRIQIDEKIAETLYKIVISILELKSEEATLSIDRHREYDIYQLFWYRESYNGDLPSRYFYCSEKEIEIIDLLIRNELLDNIKKYGNSEQLKGTDLLYQLNAGKITLEDFAKQLR